MSSGWSLYSGLFQSPRAKPLPRHGDEMISHYTYSSQASRSPPSGRAHGNYSQRPATSGAAISWSTWTWANGGILYREALRRAYTQALRDLGQLHVSDARYADAIGVYQRVLAQDNYFEAAHRELMRCYARLGETSQALRHFQSLRQLLRAELAAEPSPETMLLFERLRSGDDVE